MRTLYRYCCAVSGCAVLGYMMNVRVRLKGIYRNEKQKEKRERKETGLTHISRIPAHGARGAVCADSIPYAEHGR